MKQPYELPPTIIEGDLTETLTPEGFPHKQHGWLFAAILQHQRKHVVTDQLMNMPSVLMTCICGAQRHSWMVPPPEPLADQQREIQGGDLSSLAGKPS